MKLQYHADIQTSNGIQIVSNELQMFKKVEFNNPNRDNVPSQNVNDHHWRNLMIPFTDSIITQLDSRFSAQQSIGLLGLVPAVVYCVKGQKSMLMESLQSTNTCCRHRNLSVAQRTDPVQYTLPAATRQLSTSDLCSCHEGDWQKRIHKLINSTADRQRVHYRYPWIHVNASEGHGRLHDCFETRGTMCHSTHLKQHNQNLQISVTSCVNNKKPPH